MGETVGQGVPSDGDVARQPGRLHSGKGRERGKLCLQCVTGRSGAGGRVPPALTQAWGPGPGPRTSRLRVLPMSCREHQPNRVLSGQLCSGKKGGRGLGARGPRGDGQEGVWKGRRAVSELRGGGEMGPHLQSHSSGTGGSPGHLATPAPLPHPPSPRPPPASGVPPEIKRGARRGRLDPTWANDPL